MIGDLNWKPQNIAPGDRQPYTDPDFGKPIKSTIDLHAIQAFGHKMTPILRPLSDISHKEVANLLSVYDTAIENANYRSPIFQIQYRDKNNEQQYKHAYLTQLSPDQFLYLIKQGFDLFGLIEAGLAISKPKMQ